MPFHGGAEVRTALQRCACFAKQSHVDHQAATADFCSSTETALTFGGEEGCSLRELALEGASNSADGEC